MRTSRRLSSCSQDLYGYRKASRRQHGPRFSHTKALKETRERFLLVLYRDMPTRLLVALSEFLTSGDALGLPSTDGIEYSSTHEKTRYSTISMEHALLARCSHSLMGLVLTWAFGFLEYATISIGAGFCEETHEASQPIDIMSSCSKSIFT